MGIRITMRRYRNVFEAIAREGHEESFVPVESKELKTAAFESVVAPHEGTVVSAEDL